ncbi:AMP-binding enzyme family protein [Histomonas meleagridis]|uniref:AMP-binding enzyme family protein n=1 Tax=Histomonas meleagridis TaxID=135588 RepID=UPI003559DDA8|nr:AMP-binding enzyme family protein [Histomonas meleagridis]KAH0796897.1 AMP-binding enzyme family protein [Histomonas meleagridis]
MEAKSSPRYWFDEYEKFPKSIKTMQDFYFWTDKKHGDSPYVGKFQDNQVIWTTRHQVHEYAMSLGTSLLSLGFKAGDRIGVYCENRLECVIFLEAAQIYGFIIVFTFDAALQAYGNYVFADSGIVALYISPSKYVRTYRLFGNSIDSVRLLIVNELIPHTSENKEIHHLKQILLEPLLHQTTYSDIPTISPEDPCTICYSSGTVGAPKGVIISHRVMLHAIFTILATVNIREWIVHVSFLPLAHILERIAVGVIMFRGGRIVFASKGTANLFSDIKNAHGTGGPIIPSVLQSLHNAIFESASKSKIKNFAIKAALKIQNFTKMLGFRSRIADTFVLDSIKNSLGGCLEWFVVAGDTFSPTFQKDLSDILDIDLIAIYGLSECGGPAAISDRYDIVPGTVGCVAPGLTLQIDENNEIYLSGENLFSGYWNNPEITEKSFTNGMFRTGDKGYVDPKSGYLVVSGRSSDIFEYEPGVELALPYICFSYQKSEFVRQIFIYPFHEKRCLLAIIVPTTSIIEYYISNRQKIETPEDIEKYCKTRTYNEWARKCLRSHARYERLPPSAYLAAVRNVGRPFTIEDGLLTPTGKQRSNEFVKRFKNEIESMKMEVIKRRENKKLTDDMFEYEDETDEDE